MHGGGNSVNSIILDSSRADAFDASGWLRNATLVGKWELAGFTLRPRFQLKYASQTTPPYIDNIGAAVDGQSRAEGEIAIGPSISYRLTSDDTLAVVSGLRFDATATTLGDIGIVNYRGRVEGRIDLSLPRGGKVGTAFGLGGIGSSGRAFTAKGTLSLPLHQCTQPACKLIGYIGTHAADDPISDVAIADLYS